MKGQAVSNDGAIVPIYSDLAADPDLVALVELFVGELPDRILAMRQSFDTEDWDELGRLAHQIKGACGTYGFHGLTRFAARLESACRPPQPAEIPGAIASLIDALCRARVE